MRPARRLSAWVPVLAALGLFALASHAGIVAFGLAALPGSLMLAGGVRCLLAPDLHGTQHVATGSVFALLLALPAGLAGGWTLGVAMLALSVTAFVAAGWLAIALDPALEDVPAPAPSISYSTRVALDDAALGLMTLWNGPPGADAVRAAMREAEDAHALYTDRGWIQDPRRFHATPPVLEKVECSSIRVRGIDCEHLRFESEHEPDPDLPGRDRWLAYRENRTSHAWVLRHREPGPWLVCVHGFGMGRADRDFQAFRARRLHHRAGLNLALVVLPVHGPRAPTRFSGREFMGTSPLDFVHAESQAVWDLQRVIGWIRRQGATRVGVFGISLGGYTSAVLAGLEDGLACVIAGIPPTDLIATGEYLASARERRAFAVLERDRAIHRIVSPLALPPRVERDRRFIFAATGDHFVPAEQVRALWLHWERPRISWCTGGHLSSLMQREPRGLVDEAIAACLAPVPA